MSSNGSGPYSWGAGENLIFLISQPRAGSTMLQCILGSHPEIFTSSESWLLLHPVYALRDEGIWTEYDANLACRARQDFIQSLPAGDEDYFEGLRQMYGYLYSRALVDSGKHYFLDKTPRYYHIIPEIKRLFPEAGFIILLRNPLSVLCSIVRAWIRGNWVSLHRFKYDLLEAPASLVDGIETLSESCMVTHYETLVENPRAEMKRLCSGLGVEFLPDMLEYGQAGASSWRFGDKVGVRQYDKPDPTGAERWMNDIEDPQVWRLGRDYLAWLGRDTVNRMGYAYDDLLDTLAPLQPSAVRQCFTWPLWVLVNGLNLAEYGQVAEQRTDQVLGSLRRVLASLRRDGLKVTWGRIESEIRNKKGSGLSSAE